VLRVQTTTEKCERDAVGGGKKDSPELRSTSRGRAANASFCSNGAATGRTAKVNKRVVDGQAQMVSKERMTGEGSRRRRPEKKTKRFESQDAARGRDYTKSQGRGNHSWKKKEQERIVIS